ncbi:MAG: hypothetical protein HKN36_12040 [Hellea sp.]|nr:hypothetical protein [Hellea sp.]
MGYTRGQAHDIFHQDGAVFARKTLLFLGIWAVAYGLTQGLALFSRNELVIRSGLLTGAFSTAMLATVSIVLFDRWRKVRPGVVALLTVSLCVLFLGSPQNAYAADSCPTAVDKVQRVIAPFFLEKGGSVTKTINPGSWEADMIVDGNRTKIPVCTEWLVYQVGLYEIIQSVFIVDAGSRQNAQKIMRNAYLISGNYQPSNFGGTDFNISLGDGKGKYQYRQTYASPAHGDKNRLLAGMNLQGVRGNFVVHVGQTGSNSSGLYQEMDRFLNDQAYIDLAAAGILTINAQGSGSRVSRPGGGNAEAQLRNAEQAAAVVGMVAVLLMGAGVAVSTIQSISISLINAIQSGAQITTEDIADYVEEGIRQDRMRNPNQAFDYSRDQMRPSKGSAPPNVRSSERVRPAAGDSSGSASSGSDQREPNWDGFNDGADNGGGAFDYSREGMARGGNAPPNVRSSDRVRAPTPIYDEQGNAFETNDKGEYLAPDDKGDWRFMSRDEAQEASAALREEARQRSQEQADHDRAAADDMQRAREERQEDYGQERAEEARARAEREEAMASMEAVENAALRRGEEDVLLRSSSDRIYNEDGSINTDYMGQLRDIMRSRIGRDMATTAPDFEDNSWSRIIQESTSASLDDASNSMVVRMGAGYATGGMSEGFFQGREIVRVVEQAAHTAEDSGQNLSRTDALRAVGAQFAADNLPVNTYGVAARIQSGEEVSMLEVGANVLADIFALSDVVEGGTRVTGLQPGDAVSSAARRVLPEGTYNQATDALANARLEVESRLGQLGQNVDRADAAGTDIMNRVLDRLGIRNDSSRLTSAQAERLMNSGQLRGETEDILQNTVRNPDAATAELSEAFERGRGRGRARVDQFQNSLQELENARATGKASPRELEILQQDVKDNLARVQSDKHAMNELNALGGAGGNHPTIERFNQELGGMYAEADRRTINRLAEELNVRPEDIQVVTITNSSGNRVVIDPSNPGRPDAGGHASVWTEDGAIIDSKATRSAPGTIDGPETGRLPDAEPSAPRADKAGMDRDATMRVRTTEVVRVDKATGKVLETRIVYRDIPSSTTGRIYNEEFFEVATGKQLPSKSASSGAGTPTDFKDVHLSSNDMTDDILNLNDPHAFARRMDQATTDRLHAEAYGTGQADLDAATKDPYRGRDLSDAAGTGKTIEYKVDHWVNEAERFRELAKKAESPAAKLELLEQSAAHMEEGQRQLHKQYKNMAIKRTGAMQNALNAHGARIPRELAERMNVLDRVFNGNPKVTPAQAEATLKAMGTDTQQLSRQLSAYVEGLEKARSPSLNRPTVVFQGWQDEFKKDG